MKIVPFSYPESPHVRRHGPTGYVTYESFRQWLRDEFLFRCVYCLRRAQWIISKGLYALDHFLPQAHFPKKALDYENLLYACVTCNSAKGDQVVPNPCESMLQGRVFVYEDGSVHATETETRRLIRKLGLDDPEYCEFRRLWIGIIALSREYKPELYRRLMGFPDELPNLSTLRPSDNSKPEGVEQSCYARRARGELPETY